MKGYTDIFIKYVLKTKDFTYNTLKRIINNKYLVVLKRDEDSSVFIIDKSDYVSKVHKMVDKTIKMVSKYQQLTTLSKIQIFSKHFFIETVRTMTTVKKNIYPASNQPARL